MRTMGQRSDGTAHLCINKGQVLNLTLVPGMRFEWYMGVIAVRGGKDIQGIRMDACAWANISLFEN